MLRQRLRSKGSGLAFAGKALVVLASLLLIWGGLVVLLLALKVGPGGVQSVTGYRSVYDFFRGLGPGDFDAMTRAILAGTGILALLIFGYLALKQLPRPYLARHDLNLSREDHGEVVVAPRAIERLAETVAERRSGVGSASGRYGTDDLSVGVTLARPRDVEGALRGVQAAVREALTEHGLPLVAVNVTVTGYRSKARRELS